MEQRGKRTRPEVAEFGTILRQLREHYGLSQHELARRSGVPHHTIHRLESGQIPKPGFDDIAKLARFFNIDLESMGVLLGLWEPDEGSRARDPELRRHLESLNEIARRISEEDQHILAIQLRPLVTYWSGQKSDLPEWLLQKLARR